MGKKDYLIIIPAKDVGLKIKPVLCKLVDKRDNVIIIDDGSKDNTSNVIEEAGFKFIKHKENRGLSHAIHSGLEYARANNFNFAITLDADGQHDPEYVDEFILKLNQYDCVLGNRFHDISGIPSCKIASNLLASLIVFSITGIRLSDVSCGYHGFRMGVLPDQSNIAGFEVVYEQLFSILERGISFTTVNIPVVYPSDELLCTKVDEIISLMNVSIRHCHKRSFLPTLELIMENAVKRKDIHVEVDGYMFHCFYLPGMDSYICQTDLDKVKQFYGYEQRF